MYRYKKLTIKFSAYKYCCRLLRCRASQRRREQRVASKKKSHQNSEHIFYNTFLHIEWKSLTKTKQLCEHFPESRGVLCLVQLRAVGFLTHLNIECSCCMSECESMKGNRKRREEREMSNAYFLKN